MFCVCAISDVKCLQRLSLRSTIIHTPTYKHLQPTVHSEKNWRTLRYSFTYMEKLTVVRPTCVLMEPTTSVFTCSVSNRVCTRRNSIVGTTWGLLGDELIGFLVEQARNNRSLMYVNPVWCSANVFTVCTGNSDARVHAQLTPCTPDEKTLHALRNLQDCGDLHATIFTRQSPPVATGHLNRLFFVWSQLNWWTR